MKHYKEIRKITAGALRYLCIEKDWYTNGDNDEYEHLLLDLAERKENITSEDICEISQDIIDHSDLLEEDFTYVAHEVASIAHSYFVEE